jgi:hypothetical protein
VITGDCRSDTDMHVGRPEARVESRVSHLADRFVQSVRDVVRVQVIRALAIPEEGRVDALGDLRALKISHEPAGWR